MSKVFMDVQMALGREELKALTKENHTQFKGLNIAYEEVESYLKELNLSIENVYIAEKGYYPFWYVEGFVYIPLPTLDPEVLDMYALRGRVKEQARILKKHLASEDYESFFSLLEKQFTFDVFFQILDEIPEEKQYETFKDIYVSNYYGFKDLDKVVVRRLFESHRGKASLISLTPDDEGYVTIYRGVQDESTPIEEAYSWSIKRSVAERFATSYTSKINIIYKAKIHVSKIVDYITQRSEYEILAMPEDIEDITSTSFISITPDFMAELEESGQIDKYHLNTYKALKEEWFYNPHGVHGILHVKRVLFLSLLMSHIDKLDAKDELILIYASLYHDIGRVDDGVDKNHGVRSAEKRKTLNLPITGLDVNDIRIMDFIIKYHNEKDVKALKALSKMKAIQNKERAEDLYKRFKDCDNLDRVRLGDLDSSYLRTETGKSLLVIANQLLKNIK